jgi:hypothetical protein
MTRAELLALPPTTPLSVSNKALGIGRTKGQEMARNGTYPVRLLRVGNRYKAITSELLALLGVTDTADAGTAINRLDEEAVGSSELPAREGRRRLSA